MPIEELPLYHGTGATAARAILTSGARDNLFAENGAYALGREIRRRLLEHAKLTDEEDWKLCSRFTGPGMEYCSLWMLALRQLVHSEEQSHFEYGHFYAT